jgi:sugar lactone lactonase YvrE
VGESGQWWVVTASAVELAERPVWDDRTGTLVWADVHGGAIHRGRPGRRAGDLWSDESSIVGSVIGACALRQDGGLIACVDNGLAFLDQAGACDADPIVVDLPAGVRFNDGACDPTGRFVFGTLAHDGVSSMAALYSYDGETVSVVLSDLVESNGLGWSPDAETFYFIDSVEPVIRAYGYDPVTGELGSRRDVVSFDLHDGIPDGLVIDGQGCIWVALWAGSVVRRYAPDGQLLTSLAVPATRPTCPTIGGPGGATLFLTTAWEGMDAQSRALDPWAGHVLATTSPVPGLPAHRFRVAG